MGKAQKRNDGTAKIVVVAVFFLLSSGFNFSCQFTPKNTSSESGTQSNSKNGSQGTSASGGNSASKPQMHSYK